MSGLHKLIMPFKANRDTSLLFHYFGTVSMPVMPSITLNFDSSTSQIMYIGMYVTLTRRFYYLRIILAKENNTRIFIYVCLLNPYTTIYFELLI